MSTRTVLTLWDRRVQWRQRPVGLDAVTLKELSARVEGATYREFEPPADDVAPPPDWVWPASFPTFPRVYAIPAHRELRGVVEIPGGVVFGFKGYLGSDPGGSSSTPPPCGRPGRAPGPGGVGGGARCRDGGARRHHDERVGRDLADQLRALPPAERPAPRSAPAWLALEADRYMLDEHAPRPTVEALDILGIPPNGDSRCRGSGPPRTGPRPSARRRRLRSRTSGPRHSCTSCSFPILRPRSRHAASTSAVRVRAERSSTSPKSSRCSRRLVSRSCRWLDRRSTSRRRCSPKQR